MQVVDYLPTSPARDRRKLHGQPSPAGHTHRRIPLGDHFIAVKQWPGSGPPVVLVHGISSSGSTWESLIPALSQRFSPITLDLRGHGESGKPDRGFLHDDYVDDLDGVLTALDIDHPLLIGHSFGGLVSLGWAARHPDRAAGLIVVDSPLRIGKEFLSAFKGWMMLNALPTPALTAWYRAGNRHWNVRQAHRRARTMRKTARNVFVELRHDTLANDGIDRLAEFQRIASPVLLVRGDPASGSLVRPADVEAFGQRVANGRVVQIPGASHSLHRDRAAEFAAMAVPFLEDCVEHRHRRQWAGF